MIQVTRNVKTIMGFVRLEYGKVRPLASNNLYYRTRNFFVIYFLLYKPMEIHMHIKQFLVKFLGPDKQHTDRTNVRQQMGLFEQGIRFQCHILCVDWLMPVRQPINAQNTVYELSSLLEQTHSLSFVVLICEQAYRKFLHEISEPMSYISYGSKVLCVLFS